jgi:hypothetical protein
MTVEILKTIWKCFLKIKTFEKTNTVEPISILLHLEEREYSVAAPYFYRFYDIVEKIEVGRVAFHELLPALISYCLFTRSEILGFVFQMYDEDKDGTISKADIFKQLMM